MKITQGQYFEIEEFFTDKCRLVETEFIQEMTDHFIDGIEMRMSGTVSFEEAFGQIIDAFGGVAVIRKMEWGFQKSFIKKQVREWWTVAREYLNRPKLYRSMVISTAIAVLIFWIKPVKSIDVGITFWGFLSGLVISPLVVLIVFIIQRHLGWLRSVGLITAQNIVNRIIPFGFFTVSVLLFVLTIEFCTSLFIREIFCSLLGSASAVLTLATLEYTSGRELERYRPYKHS